MFPAEQRILKIGYAADPAIEGLLDKSKIAQIKVRQLDIVIHDLTAQLDLAKMQQQMLKEEYKIK